MTTQYMAAVPEGELRSGVGSPRRYPVLAQAVGPVCLYHQRPLQDHH